MKKHRSIVAVIAIITIIFSLQNISFAWTTTTSNNYYTTDGNKVETSVNSEGQTVYRVYQITSGQKNLVLEMFTKGSNIWNNTSSVLFSSTNKSASFCAIDRQLNVYGIEAVAGNWNANNQDVAIRYKYGFANGNLPERLSEYPGAYAFEYDQDGFATGIYTSYGLYNIQSEKIVNTANTGSTSSNYNSKYPYIIQDDEEYNCYVSQNKYYTYELTSQDILRINGRSVAGSVNPDLQCGVNDFLVFTRLDTACIVKMGSYNYTLLCDDFAEFIYDNSAQRRVIGAKDVYGQSYWIDSYNNNYIYNNYESYYYGDYDDEYYYDDYDDEYYYDDDYYDYPYVIQDDEYYYFYKNSYTEYQYELDSSERLYFWNSSGNRKSIASGVDYIAFSDEYMIYVTGNTAKTVKYGSTSATKTYSGFIDFEYDNNNMVIGIITSNGTKWL